MAIKEQDLVFGFHAVTSALRLQPDSVRELWLEKSRNDERSRHVLDVAHARNIVVHLVKSKTLDNMLGHSRHQGVAAHCRHNDLFGEKDLEISLDKAIQDESIKDLLYLILDGVQDPHNLGACLRSADAVAVNGVIIPKDRATSVTATVRKVASGAAESIPIYQVTNLARSLDLLKSAGIWLVGLDSEANSSLYDIDLKGNIGLVMGAEKSGLRRLTSDKCDFLARLPMLGQVSSLNVSVAAGVCLYEAIRQRQTGKV